MPKTLRTLFVALASVCVAFGAAAQTGAQSLSRIRMNAGIHNIDAELAQTAEEREIGLMFRTTMGANQGMLFAFERPGQQCFWMKNTLIPLDMLFIAPDGRVVSIARNAQPLSETPIPSGAPALGVLELRGGRADEMGAAPGDRVRERMFDR